LWSKRSKGSATAPQRFPNFSYDTRTASTWTRPPRARQRGCQREVERAYDKAPNAPAASLAAVPKTGLKAKAKDKWPDPEPLEGGLPAVDAFDPELLPESIRSWTEDMAEQMQCPVDYLGVSAIIGLGSALGRRIAIRPTRSGEGFEVPNLWGMVASASTAVSSGA
jgi:hypothetical protein